MKTNQAVKKNTVTTAARVCIESCQKLAVQFERTKRNLLAEFRETLGVPEKLFRMALNEAEALAWQTEYPYLVFPALATEKIQAAADWNARQEFLRRTNFVRELSI